jgi:hypothetical protein
MSFHQADWLAFIKKYQAPLAAVVAFIVGYMAGKF